MDEESPLGPRRRKVQIALVVALLHLLVGYGLLRAFAPHAITQASEVVFSAFNVAPPQPRPPPPPPPPKGDGGDAGEAGKKAGRPEPRLPVAKPSGKLGVADGKGNSTQGEGEGTSTQGAGPGAGGDGAGPSCTPRPRPVKIAGDISSTRDFPRASLDLVMGHSVTVAVTVGTDGRARSCRINRASPDPNADRIVCRLVEERFRFEPALNARCEPVSMTYGWNQRWFDPRN